MLGGMSGSPRGKKSRLFWILGGLAAGLLVLGVLTAVFLPLWVTRWLGGDQFRQLASQQISTLLKTEGELQPLEWSSFSVFSGGFASRPGAPGPWLWELRELRTEISPRLLLDRILRFSEISVGELSLTPGTRPSLALTEAAPPVSGDERSPDLFRDVQIGTIEIRSVQVQPSAASAGWGIQGLQVSAQPSKQQTEFHLRGGQITTPLSWLGSIQLGSAKGRYTDPTIFLTSLDAKSPNGGTLQLSGEYTFGPSSRAQGRVSWENWSIPGGKIGVGLFEIPARMSGEFVLQEMRPGGPVGQGQVRLVNARLEPGPGSETILGLLGALTGEPRLRGCPLTTAQAKWSMQPGIYDVTQILAEAPGLLRAVGQVRITGPNLSGQVLLGLERNLGSKVNALTGGECFRREEQGYLYETINLSGTLDNPQNDLKAKLTGAIARTAVRTGAQILEKAAGSQGGGDAAKAAGQILNSLFGAPPR
ncbi:MAG: hypothetical protein RLZZ112_621 [Verrucomicrobiota bacterium]